MLDYFVGNSLCHLVKQDDPISKLVLLILFVISVFCWTVFVSKLILLYVRRRSIRRVLDRLQSVSSIDDLVGIATHFSGTVPGQLLSHSLLTLDTLLRRKPERVTNNWDLVQYHIDQTVEQLVSNEESYLSVLSTSAAVAPLLGLFGTVWGLIHAFIRISEKQSADITVVAPGIAEALLTTLAGLVVAIPALIMYNYLVIRVRRVESQIVQLADRISLIMQQALTE